MCCRKNVCVCVCVCVCRRSQRLNQSTDLVHIRYLGSSCKYFESFFSFPLTSEIKGSPHKKTFKILIFSKMAPMILIKFCGFIVGLHSKPNYMILSAFPGKIPETRKLYFKFFFRLLTQDLNQLIDLVQNRYLGSSRKYLEHSFFSFDTNPKIKSSSHKKKRLKI